MTTSSYNQINMKFLKFILNILEKGSNESNDIRRALRKLDEALNQLGKKNPKEAFEDISAAKFYLMGTSAYRENIIEAIDDALDECWKGLRKKEYNASKIKSTINKIKRLINNPKGEMARIPALVETVRDARLWEAAKRITKENYDFNEDNDRFWAITNRIFHRMKYRIGNLSEKEVESFIKKMKKEEEKHE